MCGLAAAVNAPFHPPCELVARTRPTRPVVGGCRSCYSWGILAYPDRCHPCVAWKKAHPVGTCSGCDGTDVGLKRGYCRLCWLQAARNAGPYNTQRLLAHDERFQCHQLEFTNMRFALRRKDGKRPLWRPRREPDIIPDPPAGQMALIALLPQRKPPPAALRRLIDNSLPHTTVVLRRAQSFGAAHGWPNTTIEAVQETLAVLLAHRAPGDTVRRTELESLPRRIRCTMRIVQVLEDLDMYIDDRHDKLMHLIERRTSNLPATFAHDIETWMRHLAKGDNRTAPRSWKTVLEYSRRIQPAITAWVSRCDNLREVTPLMAHDALYRSGSSNGTANLFVALRSLFRHLKRSGRIFVNPMNGIHLGAQTLAPIIPLSVEDYQRLVTQASTPIHRLVLALAGVHAAGPAQIRALRLEHVDIWNRRLTISGIERRMDDLTHTIVLDWLVYRRETWPATANPHLVISLLSARSTAPVSPTYLNTLLRPSGVTIDQIRMDRQLEEALIYGPDPLHLQRLFGMSDSTAMRYARNARHLIG